MAIISIIVPVFNVEKYLEKCIHSILSQTFQDFELILVDDGSKDSSGNICDEYAKKDGRIIVLHKKNGGLSSARNAGLEIATGDYIGFIDSDDYIDENMYQILFTNLIKEQADISICGIYDCYLGKEPIKKEYKYCVCNTKQAIELVLNGKLVSVNAVNKLYKRKIFSNIRYPEGKQSEDAFVIIDILMQSEKIVITSEQLYYYYHRENSISTKMFKEKDLDVIDAYEKNMELIQRFYPELQSVAKMRLCWARFFVLDKILLSDNKCVSSKSSEIINYLKANIDFILKSKDFKLNRKLSIITLCLSLPMYKFLVYLNHNRNQRCYH